MVLCMSSALCFPLSRPAQDDAQHKCCIHNGKHELTGNNGGDLISLGVFHFPKNTNMKIFLSGVAESLLEKQVWVRLRVR